MKYLFSLDLILFIIREQLKVTQSIPKTPTSNIKTHDFGIIDPSETIDKNKLLIQLYGANRNFRFHLKEENKINNILFRERNFCFSIGLYDEDGRKVDNNSIIPLSVSLYTSDNISKIIESNTAGKNFFWSN
jgi:hypothetical protein